MPSGSQCPPEPRQLLQPLLTQHLREGQSQHHPYKVVLLQYYLIWIILSDELYIVQEDGYIIYLISKCTVVLK